SSTTNPQEVGNGKGTLPYRRHPVGTIVHLYEDRRLRDEVVAVKFDDNRALALPLPSSRKFRPAASVACAASPARWPLAASRPPVVVIGATCRSPLSCGASHVAKSSCRRAMKARRRGAGWPAVAHLPPSMCLLRATPSQWDGGGGGHHAETAVH